MKEVSDILDVIMKYGVPGLLFIIILLIVHRPERAEKLKALFLLPLFRAFKWGSKQYVAAIVGSTATEFINAELASSLPSLKEVTVRVKWVGAESDSVLETDGTVVLRMRDTNDQTRNTLKATQLALPLVVCPTIRGNLSEELRASIDLTLLHRLADRIGKRARPLFQQCFLVPEIQKAPAISELFQRLVQLDSAGLFTVVFLEELSALGEDLYVAGDTHDRTESVLSLLHFLINIVRRGKGEHVLLDYNSPDFSLGVILLAKSIKAEYQGVTPYVQRVDKSIRLGAESIYVLSYPQASDFLKRIVVVLDGDDRLTLVDCCEVRRRVRNQEDGGFGEIAVFRTKSVFVDHAFESRLEASGLAEGNVVEGSVVDVAKDVVLVDIAGMNGLLRRPDGSWYEIVDFRQVLAVGNRRRFLVSAVDRDRKRLHVSLRLPKDDPWIGKEIPEQGSSVDIDVTEADPTFLKVSLGDRIEARVPRSEVSWIEGQTPSDAELIGSRRRAVVLAIDYQHRVVICSLKRAEPDPWPQIHKMLPVGTPLRAIVKAVRSDSVLVDLPDGLSGVILEEALRRAGHEYADYETTLVPGQGIDVVVSKVFIARQRIRLDLSRNR